MSSNRNQAQEFCEAIVGAKDPDSWKQKQTQFEQIILTREVSNRLRELLIEDSKSFYYKGILSLFEALISVIRGGYSWATVKMYYSTYYCLRCMLCMNGCALIRNKALYTLHAEVGATPRKNSNRHYNSTHKGTIHHFIDLYKSADSLQSNTIEGLNPYLWLMEKREHINYRVNVFQEPSCYDFWEIAHKKRSVEEFKTLIHSYLTDNNLIYCFQEDHAVLALPLLNALKTRELLLRNSITQPLLPEQADYLKRLLLNMNIYLKSFEQLL
jgi:hypothetical protein